MVLQQRPQHVAVPPGERDPNAPDPALYLPAWRPWLALYGARIRLGGNASSTAVRALPSPPGAPPAAPHVPASAVLLAVTFKLGRPHAHPLTDMGV